MPYTASQFEMTRGFRLTRGAEEITFTVSENFDGEMVHVYAPAGVRHSRPVDALWARQDAREFYEFLVEQGFGPAEAKAPF